MLASLRVVAVGGPPAAGPGPRAARPPRPRAGAPPRRAPRTAARRCADRIGGSACGLRRLVGQDAEGPSGEGRRDGQPAGTAAAGIVGFSRADAPAASKPPHRAAIVLRWLLRKAPKCRSITPAMERLRSIEVPPFTWTNTGTFVNEGLLAPGSPLEERGSVTSSSGRQGFASSTLRGGRPWTSTMNRDATYLPGTLT